MAFLQLETEKLSAARAVESLAKVLIFSLILAAFFAVHARADVQPVPVPLRMEALGSIGPGSDVEFELYAALVVRCPVPSDGVYSFGELHVGDKLRVVLTPEHTFWPCLRGVPVKFKVYVDGREVYEDELGRWRNSNEFHVVVRITCSDTSCSVQYQGRTVARFTLSGCTEVYGVMTEGQWNDLVLRGGARVSHVYSYGCMIHEQSSVEPGEQTRPSVPVWDRLGDELFDLLNAIEAVPTAASLVIILIIILVLISIAIRLRVVR